LTLFRYVFASEILEQRANKRKHYLIP